MFDVHIYKISEAVFLLIDENLYIPIQLKYAT